MNDEYALNNIDSLLFKLALQTRELSQKKNDISQRIKVYSADIAEKRSCTETLHRNIKKLEEEIRVKQSTVAHSKANAKSMKATNSLLLQYEQTLKAELESRKANYNHDMGVYEERIASYKKIFQSHKEYYCQNPLAQKLIRLQAEKEEIECRIKACDGQIIMKQTELDHLIGPAVNSSTKKLPDSVSGPINESEKQFDPQTEEDSDSAVDISSLHLNQAKNGQKVSVEANARDIDEEQKVQEATACGPDPEEASNELWSYEQLDEQSWPDGMHANEQEKETELQDQAMEQQPTVSQVEDAVEDKVEEEVGTNEDQTPGEEDNEGLTAFLQSSQETNQPSPAKMTAAPSTPSFPFNFSPTSSPHQRTSDTKSPAFLFSLNSDPSTPGFSGFGFDEGTSRDEDTSFAFTSPFFSQKKTTESKSSHCAEFLFDQSEQSEEFQFAFTTKSPQATNKDKTMGEFPFSFNF
ncbi:protein SIX6OS1 isoform X2 [Seriola aureovittata]|uniref:protein SIX6OS1 isoform X2 n=1 Tax=Seriola aureovittata TaxID=2871759 RepID=UPI0024BE3072|nr:protein SIX6OS1 isoform X2 [Seriola aureovittata]